ERLPRSPSGRRCAQHDPFFDGPVRHAQGYRAAGRMPYTVHLHRQRADVRQGHDLLQQDVRRAEWSGGRARCGESRAHRRELVHRSGRHGWPITTRLEDGTFTRLREGSVMYSLRGPWVNKIVGMQQLDVKVSVRNLKLWTE